MNPRMRTVVLSIAVLAVPAILLYPAMSLSHFGPCGPTSGWALAFWAACGTAASYLIYRLLKKTHVSGGRDWMSIIRFPFWIAAGALLLLSALIGILSLPALFFDGFTHLWWFFLFSLLAMVLFAVWNHRTTATRRNEQVKENGEHAK